MDCKVYDPSWIDWWIEPPFIETIKLVWQECNLDEVALEINNNGTLPNGSSNPCSVSSFRQALAHLVDRDLIIEECFGGWAIPMYTEVPCTCCLEKYCHPEIIQGGVLEDLTHLYDPNEAAELLDENGFPIGPDGQMYWHPGVCPNYINFSDPEYDYWAEILKCASTQGEAVEAAWMCQEIYASPCRIGSVPICMPIGYQAMKRCYSGGTGGVPVAPDDGENQYRCQKNNSPLFSH